MSDTDEVVRLFSIDRLWSPTFEGKAIDYLGVLENMAQTDVSAKVRASALDTAEYIKKKECERALRPARAKPGRDK